MRPHLLAWQWSDYPGKHRDRINLLVHIVAVPVFQVAMLALVYEVAAGSPVCAGVAAAGIVLSIVAQGRGHAREPEVPAPFTGAGDIVTRLLAEQWVTFPRFVLSGAWYANLTRARERRPAVERPQR
ncbi:MAG: terminase [Candidatus Rokuibacteriota bacterium]|nr:MAG: terminase [Candidatus Rokubacteria bacterium]